MTTQVFFAQNGFEKGMLCIKRENTSKLLTLWKCVENKPAFFRLYFNLGTVIIN
jgi:hypothetical protein